MNFQYTLDPGPVFARQAPCGQAFAVHAIEFSTLLSDVRFI